MEGHSLPRFAQAANARDWCRLQEQGGNLHAAARLFGADAAFRRLNNLRLHRTLGARNLHQRFSLVLVVADRPR